MSMRISTGLSEFSFFILHFHETLEMNFSVCLIKEMRNICRACASVQAYLSFSFSYIYKIMFITCSLHVHLSILVSEPLLFELICMDYLCNYVIAIIS